MKFRLSSQGGAEWERRARPDWNRFAQPLTGMESGEAFSPNLDLLMAYMGWYKQLTSAKIDFSTIQFETLKDYSVTYWKSLPLVHRATFACAFTHGSPLDEPSWFQNWWESLETWYKRPWELPDWPGNM